MVALHQGQENGHVGTVREVNILRTVSHILDLCDTNHIGRQMGHAIKHIRIINEVHDNTKPSVKMGRKAYGS